MWQQALGEKMTYQQAADGAGTMKFGGYDNYRLPTIKELFSLTQFSGVDPSGWNGIDTHGLVPFIDTNYFAFEYGYPVDGERVIDAQWATST